jgi:AcrR family transcriptional regulator
MQAAESKNALRRSETRARLIATAQHLFAAQGFAATGTEQIVAAAGVTRGALYFHFADKTELFAAVLDAVAQEIARAIDRASAGDIHPLEALRRGAAGYLDAASADRHRAIYLVDGPSVLGLARWHEVENRYSLPLLRAGVEAVAALQGDAALDVEATARLLSGALVEAARWLAATPGDVDLRARLVSAFERLLTRLFAA